MRKDDYIRKNGNEPSLKESPERKSNAWRLIVVAVVAALAILGVSIYVEYLAHNAPASVADPPSTSRNTERLRESIVCKD